MPSLRRMTLCLTLVLASFSTVAVAGIFDNPKNLEVLPEDISPQDLRQTMRGFALDLGLRCESCHVGEANQPFDTFDFAADRKAMKATARLMLRMVAEINDHQLAALDRTPDERVIVRCATCHRGQSKPLMIRGELELAYRKGGVSAAVARYRVLKADFFGRDSYDFTEQPRLEFANQLAERKDVIGGIAFLRELHDEHGGSFMTDVTLGDLYFANDDRKNAIASYQAAQPGAPPAIQANIQKRLDGLKATTKTED